MESIPSEINILTLNCWGLKYLAKHRRERLAEIGRRIACVDPVPQIVGLQECWTQEDYCNIRKQTKHILPYGKFYYSGIFGGGLAILSKWPLEESSMLRYPLNGRPTAFFRGDWFVGKGVACARIRIGPRPKDVAEVFTSHLHAPYETEPHDSYICHRTAQAWEIAKLMKGAAERGHLVIGLGDFNMIPSSLAHRIISTHAPVRDVWRILHPDSSVGAAIDQVEAVRRVPIPTAEYNMTENGATCDSVLNTWRWNKAQQKLLGPNKPRIDVQGDTTDPRAKRLDYIFASNGFRDGRSCGWVVKSVKVGFSERHPILQCSLSDHFSVEATLLWHETAVKHDTPTKADFDAELEATNKVTFLHSPTSSVYHRSQHDVQLKPALGEEKYLPILIYDEILAMIAKYTLRERKQRRYRLYHFGASFLVTIGCLVAVWWSPRNFVAFLLMLVSTLGLSAGIIDGLIGGLFVGSELRALKEFEWEIKIARAAASGCDCSDIDEPIIDW